MLGSWWGCWAICSRQVNGCTATAVVVVVVVGSRKVNGCTSTAVVVMLGSRQIGAPVQQVYTKEDQWEQHPGCLINV